MQHPCAPGKNATSAHGHPLSLELYRTKERMENDYLVLLGHHWRTHYYIHAVWQDGSWKSVHLSSFLFKCIFFFKIWLDSQVVSISCVDCGTFEHSRLLLQNIQEDDYHFPGTYVMNMRLALIQEKAQEPIMGESHLFSMNLHLNVFSASTLPKHIGWD